MADMHKLVANIMTIHVEAQANPMVPSIKAAGMAGVLASENPGTPVEGTYSVLDLVDQVRLLPDSINQVWWSRTFIPENDV